ncbi:MAG: M48 family metalloprotease, partial [Gammaproteobacteria bacterium]
LAVIGSVGVLFGRLIKAGVSRQREYLADASAVQFTRDPAGLAGALKKIGGFGSHLDATDSEEVAHMLFSRGASAFRGWFATHPPLEERIRALDPQFAAEPSDGGGPQHSREQTDSPIAGIAAGRVGRSDQPSYAELDQANQLHTSLPSSLADAAHGREGSFLLIIALALNSQPDHRSSQLGLLRNRLGQQRAGYCERLSDELATAGVAVRLPLLEMAFPRVKDRPATQLQFLLALINELIAMDNEVEPFELALVRTLESYLREQPEFAPLGKTIVANKRQIQSASVDLVVGLAAYSHDDPQRRRDAVQRGVKTLGNHATNQYPEPERNLERLDAALSILATAPFADRRRTLVAAYASISADDHINLEEGELFRAIAAVLGCPLPPFANR